ncbi:M15 family metallopeptidase [Aphanothece sacrum]|uniref:D-alanyl-D-alanine carboxypeptidase n=1 Tax=Aphanothece sacrum FPU1 TaxID=1920663 RepID=A0A401IJV0_APHSA|nr:M15 family metallopeptidase [Aphanothece sacrum]GBF81582.1 D-alanyl-D-alanine carboxypeptidase [Aphanothece sacrum FPU1]GBF84160.1 D-alanyl-D-alanine carboxypeptidase [Aphanothece sacrum FPU3]
MENEQNTIKQPDPIDDIPEALRDVPTSSSLSLKKLGLILAGIVGLSVVVLASFLVLRSFSQLSQITPSSVTSSGSTITENPSPEAIENILGHLPYPEAPPSELKPITPDGRIKMRINAAKSFRKMQQDSRASGIILTPISGFRTIAEQEYLFFEVKRQRNQETRKRAEVSAPPKYSEHHTGYAVDIGDGNVPGTNLSPSFEQTAAFRWLKNNAAKYSFEISFPKNNPQGVSYEPWHWRYVGDRDSLETFYKARNLQPKSSN